MKKANGRFALHYFKCKQIFVWAIFALLLVFSACRKENGGLIISDPPIALPTNLQVYIPSDYKNMNFNDTSSTWCYPRSRQSEHFIVFWAKPFGDKDPNGSAIPSDYRIDIDDLLAKAESFYQMNVQTLKFAGLSLANSKLSKYKMMIFVNYEIASVATGSGYDDTVGAIWISPNVSRPAGSVVAHEIGHAFQYMVYADLGGLAGFRYGFGPNGAGGNGYWEQCANWQAYQNFPDEIFGWSNFPVYLENCHRHIHHENYRYASYFMNFYWADKHGIDIVAKIWRNAMKPEDPVQAYMRITGINTEQFNDEVYDAAAHFVTWDLKALRTLGANSIGKQPFDLDKQADGSFMVNVLRCPETTGYNVIPLKVPTAGTVVSTQFTGTPNAPGFNLVDAAKAGYRFGFVALLENGTRVYGQMGKGTTAQLNFTVPQNCTKLWFVVTGAPTTYTPHAWDDNNTNDEQWPYKVKFANTTLTNDIVIPPGAVPQNASFDVAVTIPYDPSNLSTVTTKVDLEKICTALALTPAQILDAVAKQTLKVYGVDANGQINTQIAADGFSTNYDSNSNVVGDESLAKIYSFFDAGNLAFVQLLYPKYAIKNDAFTIKQAFIYTYEPGKSVQINFNFLIKTP